jgi:hypothetical protein
MPACLRLPCAIVQGTYFYKPNRIDAHHGPYAATCRSIARWRTINSDNERVAANMHGKQRTNTLLQLVW